MHFEITLRSKETYEKHYSYGLVFIPCPVWVKQDKQIINLNPESPKYRNGSIKKLINCESLDKELINDKEAIVNIRNIGHGTNEDMYNLLNDLNDEGFDVSIYG